MPSSLFPVGGLANRTKGVLEPSLANTHLSGVSAAKLHSALTRPSKSDVGSAVMQSWTASSWAALIFKYQLYPLAHSEFPRRVQSQLGPTVDAPRAWHRFCSARALWFPGPNF